MSYNPYGIGNTLNFNNTYNTMNNFAIENQSNHWIDYKDDYSISKNSSDHSVDNVNDDESFDLDIKIPLDQVHLDKYLKDRTTKENGIYKLYYSIIENNSDSEEVELQEEKEDDDEDDDDDDDDDNDDKDDDGDNDNDTEKNEKNNDDDDDDD